jgi:hypothetical protein
MEPSPVEELDRWDRQIVADLEALAGKIEPLIAERQALNAKLDLIRKLKSLENVSPGASDDAPRNAPKFNGLQDAVRSTLLEHGKPMHLSELRESLRAKGVPIPGRGTDANLIVHLRRAPDVFERKARGTYGLTGWNRKQSGR